MIWIKIVLSFYKQQQKLSADNLQPQMIFFPRPRIICICSQWMPTAMAKFTGEGDVKFGGRFFEIKRPDFTEIWRKIFSKQKSLYTHYPVYSLTVLE